MAGNRNFGWLIIPCPEDDLVLFIHFIKTPRLIRTLINLIRSGRREINIPLWICAKSYPPVSTVLSAPVDCFSASDCPRYNKAFVQHKEDTVLPNEGWKKVLCCYQSRQNKPFPCMSGFLLRLNMRRIRVRRLLPMREARLDARCSGELALHIREVLLWVEPCVRRISTCNDWMKCHCFHTQQHAFADIHAPRPGPLALGT